MVWKNIMKTYVAKYRNFIGYFFQLQSFNFEGKTWTHHTLNLY